MPTPLAAVIEGGTYRYVSTLVDILFDGSSSFDPDDPTSPLTYEWGCISKLADSDAHYGYNNKSGVIHMKIVLEPLFRTVRRIRL